MAWPSGRLRGLAMSFFIFCTCIFASTTKTLTCIFYICTHKDIFLIFTHVCNYIYIYIYTTISIHIYPYMDTFYIYIYTFSIYTYMYLFPRHPTTWDGIFLGFSQTKIWSGRTVHLKGGSPGCRGIWSLHPQKINILLMVQKSGYITSWYGRYSSVYLQGFIDVRWCMTLPSKG